ncbi:MAG: glycoside hydrolase family 28 protein [Filimonas sp.]|nr:glycoside hydrolase family 28 protein [Filimonas sp.]
MSSIYKRIAILVLSSISISAAFAGSINIMSYGAKADGKTVNTKAIQKAIDACTQTSGTVIIPEGRFVTGTLYLKNNVTLLLEKGAVLLGSTNPGDYTPNTPRTVKCVSTHSRNGKSKFNAALLYAEDQDNISIMGEGTIDGQGDVKAFPREDKKHDRPKLILFISCRNVTVKNVLLTNSAFWMQDYLGCDGVVIDGIRVINHSNWNNDGLDIDSKNVRVSNCEIDSDDDGICLKSYLRDKPCENVVITNCIVGTNCDAIKMGTPGAGGFKNIAISNCVVRPSKFDNFRFWKKKDQFINADTSMVNGISIECVDGGKTDGIVIDNIAMKGVQTPIFIRVGSRNERMQVDSPLVSTMRNIIISNIISDQLSRRTSSITAIPGSYIENVKLNHIMFDVYSEGTQEERQMSVPEKEDSYPSPHSFGPSSPAYGFYIRHVKNITINDVQVNKLADEQRYPIAMEDVHNAYLNDWLLQSKDGSIRSLLAADLRIDNCKEIQLDHKPIK